MKMEQVREAKITRDISDAVEKTVAQFCFLDWFTLGTLSASKQRGEIMVEDPSIYNIGNWLTAGTFDVAKGALAPDEPLSFEHLMNNIGLALLLYGAYKSMTHYNHVSDPEHILQSTVRENEKYLASIERSVTSDINLNSLDDLLNHPEQLARATPEQYYRYFLDNEYNPQPLMHGNLKNIPFEQGGGFKINWGGDRILQYHPAGLNHHGNGAYWKMSSGLTGVLRFDLNGNLLP